MHKLSTRQISEDDILENGVKTVMLHIARERLEYAVSPPPNSEWGVRLRKALAQQKEADLFYAEYELFLERYYFG